MDELITFLWWLSVFVSIFAGCVVLSKLSVPQKDYSDDWRASL